MSYANVLVRSSTRFSFALSQKPLPLRRTLIMSISPGKSKRPICPTCSKPTRTCLCSRILTSGIDNPVSVTILQHSLESKHPLNSTRIARLGLRNLNVVTVSDVNLEAQFVIRLTKPDSEAGLVRNDSYNLAFHQALDIGGNQKSVHDEHASSSDSKKESNSAGKCTLKNDMKTMKSSNHVVDSKLSVEMQDNAEIDGTTGDSAITVVIGKHGVINSVSHIWRSLTQNQKPSLINIFSCPEACEALSKGFMVKKLQRRKLEGSINLQDDDEECEFEVEVPPGSVLLFPSEKAVDITDLDAIDFEIKNLIILDGTWAKARRVYSENPWLNILPHIKLKVDKMSLYSEVRREPKDGYLSTIESIVHCLKALGDNHEGLDNLLDAFESMVGYQRRFKDERLTKRCEV
ncbi:hypothetical protein QN277_018555 [Acacia crassicarpa]|uniref:tRNA-uridine aminocarboxypropyltransferase n=1 Tax=Acacia crassicarpa TaxID=499986 RepID=A0AAE1MPF2_9FABA|nr:hypothetical protein QN277_018555 [Acacia crassicarpa]